MKSAWDQEASTRNIVVAVDLSDQSLKATQWTAYELCRPGDVVHLVHVARILSPQTTIQHGYAGASYTVPDPRSIDQREHVKNVQEIVKARFTAELDQHQVPNALHIFLDTDNAPASAVCDSIFKVADQVKAALIVMACHNKAYGWDTMFLGSVADYATRNSTYPVMVIRDFKVPLVIPAAASHSPQDAGGSNFDVAPAEASAAETSAGGSTQG